MSNKMRFLYLLVCLAAAMGFVVSGCEVDDDADADGGASTDGATTDGATTDGATDGGTTTLEYRFVRVQDISGNASGEDPGADIDAIILTKSGGGDVMPQRVADSSTGSNEPTAINPQEVLTMDAFSTSSPSEGATCNLYRDTTTLEKTFFSLGGDGYVTVEFPSPGLEVGDTVRVLEVGNCNFIGVDSNGTAGAEAIQVQVSVGSDTTGAWQTIVSSGEGPLVSATLTADMLPPVSAAP